MGWWLGGGWVVLATLRPQLVVMSCCQSFVLSTWRGDVGGTQDALIAICFSVGTACFCFALMVLVMSLCPLPVEFACDRMEAELEVGLQPVAICIQGTFALTLLIWMFVRFRSLQSRSCSPPQRRSTACEKRKRQRVCFMTIAVVVNM